MTVISLMKDYNMNADWVQQANRYFYPFLKSQVTEVCKEDSLEFNIADLGCSFGMNSMQCIRAALDGCSHHQKRINVYLNDLPSNDFGEVFRCLEDPCFSFKSHPACTDKDISTFIIGKSFYEQVLPTNQMDLIMCFISIHWLKSPSFPLSESSIFPSSVLSTFDEKAKAASCAHHQLVEFLGMRACELVSGGRLVISFLSSDFVDHASLEWKKFLEKHGLDPIRFKSANIPLYFRTFAEIKVAVDVMKGSFLPLYMQTFPCNDPPEPHETFKCATFNSLLISLSDADIFNSKQECETFVQDFYAHLESTRSEYNAEVHCVILKRT